MKKVGELFIDIIAKTTGLERGLDRSAKKAEDAGRKIENSANQGARGIRNMDVQVSSLAQNLAGLARFGGIAGGITAGAGAILSEAKASQARADSLAQAPGVRAQAGTEALGGVFAASLSALTPSEQLRAQRSNAIVQKLRQNNAEYQAAVRKSTSGFFGSFGGIGSIIGQLGFGPLSSNGRGRADLELQRDFPTAFTQQEIATGGLPSVIAGADATLRAETEAIGNSANPFLQNEAALDTLRLMLESLQRIEQRGNNELPGPGGAIGSGP